jgi:thiamine phosphate synthase YjbQ (UPF0047 family)
MQVTRMAASHATAALAVCYCYLGLIGLAAVPYRRVVSAAVYVPGTRRGCPRALVTTACMSATSKTALSLTTQQHPYSITSSTTQLDAPLGAAVCEYHTVTIPATRSTTAASSTAAAPPLLLAPRQEISINDLTTMVSHLLQACGMQQGLVTIQSRHTTTAITINEHEVRLAADMQDYFLQLAPPDERSSSSCSSSSSSSSNNERNSGVRYKHNDIHLRPDSQEEADRCRQNGWDITDAIQLQKWRDQEPINAHSHILSMLLGSSESIPVVNGNMAIGQVCSVKWVRKCRMLRHFLQHMCARVCACVQLT